MSSPCPINAFVHNKFWYEERIAHIKPTITYTVNYSLVWLHKYISFEKPDEKLIRTQRRRTRWEIRSLCWHAFPLKRFSSDLITGQEENQKEKNSDPTSCQSCRYFFPLTKKPSTQLWKEWWKIWWRWRWSGMPVLNNGIYIGLIMRLPQNNWAS